jgi:GTP-binding protein HflX
VSRIPETRISEKRSAARPPLSSSLAAGDGLDGVPATGARFATAPSSGERALLVAVEIASRRKPLPRSAALARDSAALSRLAESNLDGEEPLDAVANPSRDAARSHSTIEDPTMDFEASLAEFRELVLSAGAEIVGEVAQRRAKADPATLLGSGKVEEIAAIAASTNASVVLFDHDLTPTQLRNLEDALPCRVVDRTQLILDIFARHARTREGKLQVELAQLEYMLPRLAGKGSSMSQLGGGIGTRGPGETQLETDRRKIQRKVLHLKAELESVRRVRGQQRNRREAVPVPTVALVGYTNAGKSTLFNALTHAGVLESSRMFATLDPKLRSLALPSRRKILLSDTVGFIRNLPHTLVTSFRATLEEVQKAEVLLHIQDCSSATRDEHKAEVEKVLKELGVEHKPRIEVLNKVDLLPDAERELLGEDAVAVSAKTGAGLDHLLRSIDEALRIDPIVRRALQVPQDEGGVLAALEAGAVVHGREFLGQSVRIEVSGPTSLLGRYRRFWAKG